MNDTFEPWRDRIPKRKEIFRAKRKGAKVRNESCGNIELIPKLCALASWREENDLGPGSLWLMNLF